jgi:transposase InsO family protein
MARTHDAKAFRMLTIIDEYTRESLAIGVSRRFDADAALYRLTELFGSWRPPDYIRSDHGSEFTAKAVWEWLSRVGVIPSRNHKVIFGSRRLQPAHAQVENLCHHLNANWYQNPLH